MALPVWQTETPDKMIFATQAEAVAYEQEVEKARLALASLPNNIEVIDGDGRFNMRPRVFLKLVQKYSEAAGIILAE